MVEEEERSLEKKGAYQLGKLGVLTLGGRAPPCECQGGVEEADERRYAERTGT